MSISNFFVPNRQEVSTITNANPGVVTTTQAHGYESGLRVRFFFPLDVGMNQLDGKVVKITKIDDTKFSIGINTSKFDVWNVSRTSQSPQVIPVAERADMLSQATENNENIVPET